jgi:hypothetical protein
MEDKLSKFTQEVYDIIGELDNGSFSIYNFILEINSHKKKEQ